MPGRLADREVIYRFFSMIPRRITQQQASIMDDEKRYLLQSMTELAWGGPLDQYPHGLALGIDMHALTNTQWIEEAVGAIQEQSIFFISNYFENVFWLFRSAARDPGRFRSFMVSSVPALMNLLPWSSVVQDVSNEIEHGRRVRMPGMIDPFYFTINGVIDSSSAGIMVQTARDQRPLHPERS